jgi:hypothetical protein
MDDPVLSYVIKEWAWPGIKQDALEMRCQCGGVFQHVDEERNLEVPGTTTDSYQCGICELWAMITWDSDTEEVIKVDFAE